MPYYCFNPWQIMCFSCLKKKSFFQLRRRCCFLAWVCCTCWSHWARHMVGMVSSLTPTPPFYCHSHSALLLVCCLLGNCISCLSWNIKENHRNFTKMFIIFTSPKVFQRPLSPCLCRCLSLALSLPLPLSFTLCVWFVANIFCIQISQVDKVVKKARNETRRNETK